MKARFLHLLLFALLLAGQAMAQGAFTSGSTGSDHALDYTGKTGVINFDPAALGLDPSGDNIFNFTSITIPSAVTLNLTSTLLRNKPVIWLSQGDVNIAGTLVLDGQAGTNLSGLGVDWITQRVPSQPGPGGFPGGVGARPATNTLPATPASPGLGPGGAPVQTSVSCNSGGSGSFATPGSSTPAGSTYGNTQLVPLIGGSGGSGGCVAASDTTIDAAGGTGGGGGGAIRIVSGSLIALTGHISALGGTGGNGRSGGTGGGAGAGGAVNLIAPNFSGNGSVYAYGSGEGYVTINSANNTFTGSLAVGGLTPTIRPLVAPPLPAATTVPTVTITSVNGVSVPQPPQGAFQTPDVTINSATAVTINISAVGVPAATVVQLNIQSELGPDQNISCTPLSVSLTATCSAAFPTSVSRILASASW